MPLIKIEDEFGGWKVICTDRMRIARETLAEEYRPFKKMAKLTGMTEAQLSMYFSGRKMPNLKNLKKLALYLQVPADYLLGLKVTKQ